ncbi:MAG: hypothetical protein ABR525_05895 [Candidatus Limnocylindria bacterium]
MRLQGIRYRPVTIRWAIDIIGSILASAIAPPILAPDIGDPRTRAHV